MKTENTFYFLLSAVVLALDQATKYLVKGHIALYEVIRVFPCFNLVYVRNVGSAFGLFRSLGNTFFVVIALVAMIVIAVMMIKEPENRPVFSLILGGAAGNLADRLMQGYVVDFLDVYVGNYHWPAFNVADSALTVGIFLLAVNLLFHSGRNSQTP